MNVALLASFAAPYSGNFISSVLFLGEKIKEKGGKITFVFPNEAKDRTWINLFKDEKVYFLPYAPYNFSTVRKLRKIFAEEKINLVYSHFGGWDIASRFAAPFVKNVWHCHMNIRTNAFIKKFKYFLKYRLIAGKGTASIAVSGAVEKKLLAVAERKTVFTIPNGIDFSRLNIKKTYKKVPEKALIFAWQPVVKGFDTACDAFETGENGLNLVVSCQKGTEKYISKRFSNVLPQWLEMREPTDNVASLYDDADIFLSASTTEGFSFALAEAIYSGLPCVISDIEGTSWALEMKNVFVFEAKNPKSLNEALEKCKGEPMTFENAEYNRKTMLQKYSLESWAKSVLNVLNIK